MIVYKVYFEYYTETCLQLLSKLITCTCTCTFQTISSIFSSQVPNSFAYKCQGPTKAIKNDRSFDCKH